ncbi:Nitrogen assimilation transcription factor nirA [Hyphodiscus hymeniophilus]|uniref:Nitrogen assimilation transcription factor nirA n=1 Tax=Hyphodiscus hymeniophilus TaxID=353542 RepID=A0A9P6SK57_9HELO|nr:Nitrogen assimilation transcription factor nirA [Hyphodiscus hymeniophilus]
MRKSPTSSNGLRKSEPYESIVEWLGRSPIQDIETVPPRDHHSAFEGSDHKMDSVSSRLSRWTTVKSNHATLNHLLRLYFAWIHPVHTLFSESELVDSYHRYTDEDCSSVLVNAICAMACHFHSAADDDEIDFAHLGAEFREVVRADIADEDNKKVTTIQAFAIMFLIHCACSNVPRAVAYLKIATTSLPGITPLDSEGLNEVLKNTVRGIRYLNVEWAQATFQVPPTTTSVPFEDNKDYDDKVDGEPWYCYRYAEDTPPPWPVIVAATNREKSKLVDIINDASSMMTLRRVLD